MGWSWAVWFVQVALVHNVPLAKEQELAGSMVLL